jgi:hypothetical protein
MESWDQARLEWELPTEPARLSAGLITRSSTRRRNWAGLADWWVGWWVDSWSRLMGSTGGSTGGWRFGRLVGRPVSLGRSTGGSAGRWLTSADPGQRQVGTAVQALHPRSNVLGRAHHKPRPLN